MCFIYERRLFCAGLYLLFCVRVCKRVCCVVRMAGPRSSGSQNNRNVSFVHYKEPMHAYMAVAKMNGVRPDGCGVELEYGGGEFVNGSDCVCVGVWN